MNVITQTANGYPAVSSANVRRSGRSTVHVCPRCGGECHRPGKPNPAVCDRCLNRCRRCGIYIFQNADAAASAGVPWARAINLAVAELCIGCAGADRLPLDSPVSLPPESENSFTPAILKRLPASQPGARQLAGKENKPMPKVKKAEPEAVFTSFEVGVKPPPILGRSKYGQLVERVLSVPFCENGRSEWIRITFGDLKSAKSARSHLAALRPQWRQVGHDAIFQTVSNGEAAYLYIQRQQVEPAEVETEKRTKTEEGTS